MNDQQAKINLFEAIKSGLSTTIVFVKRDAILQLRSLADLINISLMQILITILLAFVQTNQDLLQKGSSAVFFASLMVLFFFSLLLNLENFYYKDYKTEWLFKVISSNKLVCYFFAKNITLIIAYFLTIIPNTLLLFLITKIQAFEIFRYMFIVLILSFFLVSLLSFVATVIIKYKQTNILTVIIVPFILPVIMSTLLYVVDNRISAIQVVGYLSFGLFVLTPFINRYIFLEK